MAISLAFSLLLKKYISTGPPIRGIRMIISGRLLRLFSELEMPSARFTRKSIPSLICSLSTFLAKNKNAAKRLPRTI
jgi:hypothetical protein